MFRTPGIISLVLSSALLAACGRGDDRETRTDSSTGVRGEHVTATGCLSMNPESRLYVLTTAPDPVAGTVGGVIASPPTSITYQLANGEGLENHIGHEVEVTGHADQDAAQTAEETTERTDTPHTAPGTEATIETTTETRIRVVPLQVESFRMISTECVSGDGETTGTGTRLDPS
jgi:hypothetical protein